MTVQAKYAGVFPSVLFLSFDDINGMHFILDLKYKSLKKQEDLRGVMQYCGAEVSFNLEDATSYSAVIVDHEEVVDCLMPAFKYQFLKDCLSKRKLCDISKYRQDATKHIGKYLDSMMDVVYFRYNTWDSVIYNYERTWIKENAQRGRRVVSPDSAIAPCNLKDGLLSSSKFEKDKESLKLSSVEPHKAIGDDNIESESSLEDFSSEVKVNINCHKDTLDYLSSSNDSSVLDMTYENNYNMSENENAMEKEYRDWRAELMREEEEWFNRQQQNCEKEENGNDNNESNENGHQNCCSLPKYVSSEPKDNINCDEVKLEDCLNSQEDSDVTDMSDMKYKDKDDYIKSEEDILIEKEFEKWRAEHKDELERLRVKGYIVFSPGRNEEKEEIIRNSSDDESYQVVRSCSVKTNICLNPAVKSGTCSNSAIVKCTQNCELVTRNKSSVGSKNQSSITSNKTNNHGNVHELDKATNTASSSREIINKKDTVCNENKLIQNEVVSSSSHSTKIVPSADKQGNFAEEFDAIQYDELPKPSKQNKHTRALYSMEERQNILKYIVHHNEFGNLKGTQLWKTMERRKVCPKRTWQSMKEHFIKKIVYNLDDYPFLTNNQKLAIKRNYFC